MSVGRRRELHKREGLVPRQVVNRAVRVDLDGDHGVAWIRPQRREREPRSRGIDGVAPRHLYVRSVTTASIRTEFESTVLATIGSLTVTTIGLVTATPLAPVGGVMATTVGLVVSAAAIARVVKLLEKGSMVLPVRSRKPVSATL